MNITVDEKDDGLRALDDAIEYLESVAPVSRLQADWGPDVGFTLLNSLDMPMVKGLSSQMQNYLLALHAAKEPMRDVMITARACLASLDHSPHSGYIKQGLSIAAAINETR